MFGFNKPPKIETLALEEIAAEQLLQLVIVNEDLYHKLAPVIESLRTFEESVAMGEFVADDRRRRDEIIAQINEVLSSVNKAISESEILKYVHASDNN
jgi:hypothetical protein